MFTISQKSRRFTAILTTVVAGFIASSAVAGPGDSSVKLLTANFAPRTVVQVEAGDFHFLPGQVAPIHTHSAPAIGYVAKGSIIYQVEGEQPQILNEGDAFYEPVGPRILRFDNASATQEAIFLDFNLEQEGEPFIVFEQAPTGSIDRRTLPTFDLKDAVIDQVDVHASDIAAGATITLDPAVPTVGVVAEGVIELRVNGAETQRIVAGQSFALPQDGTGVTVVNGSGEVAAKVITFLLIPEGSDAS
ncbi:MAG: quercetin dioxygenase-like cupin family protein [Paracoccaceae bacterium]|jgi:quercetin dioxygenase-like cupin family protein